MTPDEFKAAREALGYSKAELARRMNMGENGGKSIARWERGERPVNPIAAVCLDQAQAIKRLRSALGLAIWLGCDLGLTEMEIDAINMRAGMPPKEKD